MSNEFFSPEGDIENYFVSEYWLIDQYIGDQLWIWGAGSLGALGNNATTNRSTPVTTFAGGTNWEQASVGNSFTAAIKTDGTLWVWGGGSSGRLGTNDATNRTTPVTTFAGGTNWKQVSSGGYHAAAIKTDGTLWIWGFGDNGRLGDANTIGRSTPVTTFAGGNNWKQVSVANVRTVAIKTDGTLWTWGSGGSGALGNAATTGNISTPVTTFAGGNNWKQVSAGNNHAAAIKTDGTLWIWGSGTTGALGNGATSGSVSTPVTTFAGGSSWKQVSCGNGFTAAIKTDGTLWIWGGGGSGRLGTNDATNRSTPVTAFSGGTNWKQVSCGSAGVGSHTSAVESGINAEYPLS